MRKKYVKNESLPTIKKNYPGNRIILGRFVNEYKGSKMTTLKDIFQYFLFKRKERKKKTGKEKKLASIALTKIPEKDSITWLGHAGFLITLGGKKIALDPHLTSMFPIKRAGKIPITPQGLGSIDYCCITHGHRDHLDKKTIQNMDIKEALIPLGGKKLFAKFNKNAHIQIAGWWQQYKTKDVNIYFLPAKHWFARWLADTNEMLWGSFIIQYKKKTIYCSGDTGYTKHFGEIKKYFPNINYCIMPTTFYKPDRLAAAEHMPIKDSVQAFEDLKGKHFIPMHYGTFGLGQGNIHNTVNETEKYFKKRTRKQGQLHWLSIGEPYYI
jgi:L-ascorbate metabolism protein UlaG (beta-lactamase superfamily)